ncbi:uncharacterized protein TM35_000741090 [Trypanosoma theileri]|uniref:Uncharacterized protein n=1 Tax=Trypanosoma theileri TaxID=67003 RepID=A0A1X0NF68_9TRYP|nr:uncharacterized protein TM35_000741090 [Trypanosoma theileri]ORC83362.1 hypothetical protein TM35_000741090 [Trypanosoma theileri]
MLSAIFVCAEGDAKSCPPADGDGAGASGCTSDTRRTHETTTTAGTGSSSSSGGIFISLHGEEDHYRVSPSTKGSNSHTPRDPSSATLGQGGLQGQDHADRTEVHEDGSAVSSDIEHREGPVPDSISSSLSGAGQPGTQERVQGTHPTVTTTEAHSPQLVDSKHTETQSESETAPDNSTVNHSGDASQNPSQATENTAATNTTATTGSEETNSTTLSSTENTTTEAPTTTPSPSPVPNAEISTIASTQQKNKGNADSSRISSVWVRVPLLIVVTLANVLVC